MAGVTIKVAPEVLKAKAADIRTQIDNVKKALDVIDKQIRTSKTYWEGDASNTHRQKYCSLKDEISKVITDLYANPRNLLTMAGLYTETENDQQATANTLPTDAIS